MDERIPVMNEEVQCDIYIDIIENHLTLLLEEEGIDLIVEKKRIFVLEEERNHVLKQWIYVGTMLLLLLFSVGFQILYWILSSEQIFL